MPDLPPNPRPRPFRTLLAEHQARDYDELDDGRGMVRLWHLGHRIGVFESSGSLHESHAAFIIQYHARHIEAYARPWYTFGNWMTLKAYTPDVRRLLTDWQASQRYDGIYVAHDSRLLAMSIGMANSVLDNSVKVVPNEEALDDILIEVRKQTGT
ncbi:MAG: hypothetical protein R3B40_27870 [Polyangiales bacterium]|nr:hypothetical protein [Myxococcales bacterium]MCB9656731.1 hypothetical protein [Sandaracinaceae bacterium]